VKKRLFDAEYFDGIAKCVALLTEALKRGNKLLICGNGGSAADAQHIAAELVSRFEMERAALPAIALNGNSSILTAVGNDYAYDIIFARQVEAFGQAGDVLIAISTSGNADNVFLAAKYARAKSMHVIALLGKGGGRCKCLADVSIVVPAERTSRIQEAHIMIGHILCSLIERKLFVSHE
jgi:D-sedoheptulose 7-phosphate isomerase